MRRVKLIIVALMAIGGAAMLEGIAPAAALEYAGTHYDIGGTFFPTYTFPQNSIVPWRSDSGSNTFASVKGGGQRYYGTAGYALFRTRFDFPDGNSTPGQTGVRTDDESTFSHILDLPDFVTVSDVIAHEWAGGFTYALIDDPVLQHGIRQWTFDGTDYPPANGSNGTGVVPYVKLGVLNAWDEYGHNPAIEPAGRWVFQVGNDIPPDGFRVGVMSDGLGGEEFAPGAVFLYEVSLITDGVEVQGYDVIGEANTGVIPLDEPGTPITPGTNRFVDMHFFDVKNAQPGDIFVIAAQDYPGNYSAAISGVSFDVLPGNGDYNGNGTVDAADYTYWRDTLGSTVDLSADGNNNQIVDEADFYVWRQQFGTVIGSGAGSGNAAVPEPSSAVLFCLAAAALCLVRRTKPV